MSVCGESSRDTCTHQFNFRESKTPTCLPLIKDPECPHLPKNIEQNVNFLGYYSSRKEISGVVGGYRAGVSFPVAIRRFAALRTKHWGCDDDGDGDGCDLNGYGERKGERLV